MVLDLFTTRDVNFFAPERIGIQICINAGQRAQDVVDKLPAMTSHVILSIWNIILLILGKSEIILMTNP